MRRVRVVGQGLLAVLARDGRTARFYRSGRKFAREELDPRWTCEQGLRLWGETLMAMGYAVAMTWTPGLMSPPGPRRMTSHEWDRLRDHREQRGADVGGAPW